jgi:DNA replication protein DnaC
MTDSNDFHQLTGSDKFRTVKHNPIDFDKFKKFQKGLDARMEKAERNKLRESIVRNVTAWEESLPSRWSTARLEDIDNPAVKEIEAILSVNKFSSMFITGESGSGKTYLAYAITRRYLEKGHISPSKIKVISGSAITEIANSGFSGADRFNKLFHQRNAYYLFDGMATTKPTPKELQLWESLIDHIYSNSLTVVMTSNLSASKFSDYLSDSANSKFTHLIHDKEVLALGKNAPRLQKRDKKIDKADDGALVFDD